MFFWFRFTVLNLYYTLFYGIGSTNPSLLPYLVPLFDGEYQNAQLLLGFHSHPSRSLPDASITASISVWGQRLIADSS